RVRRDAEATAAEHAAEDAKTPPPREPADVPGER
ncbi:MAG: hypothetical protein JWR30_2336, partial [Conexibacter sp.]|nr:hypothetical protein [Conexibacter sp.]